VALRIYDVGGRLVRTLVDDVREPGVDRARWDGRDDHGRRSAAGVYFARLEADGRKAARKVVLLAP
jgi:flagellar hook assembly protein FlgD